MISDPAAVAKARIMQSAKSTRPARNISTARQVISASSTTTVRTRSSASNPGTSSVSRFSMRRSRSGLSRMVLREIAHQGVGIEADHRLAIVPDGGGDDDLPLGADGRGCHGSLSYVWGKVLPARK